MTKKDEAVKYSDHKPRWCLLPWKALEQVVRAMEYGLHEGTKKEREPGDWKKGTNWTNYSDAAMRHMIDWQTGEDNDESELSHLAHAAASILILLYFVLFNIGTDNRNEG